MLLTYSKSLRIDLFDFFIIVKKSKLCYNKKEITKTERIKNEQNI